MFILKCVNIVLNAFDSMMVAQFLYIPENTFPTAGIALQTQICLIFTVQKRHVHH